MNYRKNIYEKVKFMLKDNVQVNINISVQIFEVNVDLPAFLQTIQG